MERFTSLLLDVWRECCRHIEIEESLARVAPLLRDDCPSTVLVRRLDVPRGCVVPVAAAGVPAGSVAACGPDGTEVPQLDRSSAWAHEAKAAHAARADTRGTPAGLAARRPRRRRDRGTARRAKQAPPAS